MESFLSHEGTQGWGASSASQHAISPGIWNSASQVKPGGQDGNEDKGMLTPIQS